MDTLADDTAAAQPQSKAAKPSAVNDAIDKVAEIAALSGSVAGHYQQQAGLVQQQAQAEWALSLRSLTIAAAIMVCFGAGVVMLWGSILALSGVLLLQLVDSIAVTIGCLLLLQVLALAWCWRSMRYLFKQVGFVQTLAQLRQVFSSTPQPAGGQDADSNAHS